uniref:non-specific serine/threonine protein kinase n=1 Tax=Fagus sylvatica TaxID=28930 RepID=A0A2N9GQ05_FAGSY
MSYEGWTIPLPWSDRIKIALGAAKGLAFLHNDPEPVIHRNIETSNILLDSEYNAKISDFGLARAGPQGDETHVTTRVVGTYGYAAPEYVMTGRRSMDKKRPSGEQNLVTWARPYLADNRKYYQLVDPCLELNFSIKAAQKVSQLAYKCLSRDSKSRPTMDEVVKLLTPLQDLNDFAILSYNARISKQGRCKKRPRSAHGSTTSRPLGSARQGLAAGFTTAMVVRASRRGQRGGSLLRGVASGVGLSFAAWPAGWVSPWWWLASQVVMIYLTPEERRKREGKPRPRSANPGRDPQDRQAQATTTPRSQAQATTTTPAFPTANRSPSPFRAEIASPINHHAGISNRKPKPKPVSCFSRKRRESTE